LKERNLEGCELVVKNGKKDKNGIYHIILGTTGCQEKPYNDDYLKHDYTEYYNYTNNFIIFCIINSTTGTDIALPARLYNFESDIDSGKI